MARFGAVSAPVRSAHFAGYKLLQIKGITASDKHNKISQMATDGAWPTCLFGSGLEFSGTGVDRDVLQAKSLPGIDW